MPPSIYSQACLLILSFHSIDRRTARAHVPIRATTLSSPRPTTRPNANNTNLMRVRNGQEPELPAATSTFPT